jgi:outer membrane receptor protein involved in Fe transport
MNRIAHRAPIFLCTVAAAFAPSGPAQSQTSESSATQTSERLQEVTVTGSRLVVDGSASPTPLTVLAADQLLLAAPSTIADGLAQVPQFRGSQRPSSFISAQNPAGAHLNLRALGSNRTLVLLDGRRTAPSTATSDVDVNLYPNLLIERVEIVTGGASAAYGSDAIAGVVNYVLDHNFTGLRGELNGGMSSREDAESMKFALAGGKRLLDDRLHVMASVEYFDSDGVLDDRDRKWNHRHFGVIQNPTWPADGRTRFLWRPGVTGTDLAYGGVISAGPLRGIQFGPGGVPMPFEYGTEVSAATMIGGDGVWEPRGNMSAALETQSAFAHARYEVSPDFNIFAEASYAETETQFPFLYGAFSGAANFTVFNDNAYLPDSILTAMADNAITNFRLGRISRDWGRSQASTPSKFLRGSLGFERQFEKFALDGYVDVGRTDADTQITGLVIRSKVYEAADAVEHPITGEIVCGSTVTNPNNGCVPLNLFGDGAASAEAIDYVTGESWSNQNIEQTAAGVSLRGELFSNWAGEVLVGGGLAYHRNTVEILADPTSLSVIAPAPGSKGMPANLVGVIGDFQFGNTTDLPKSTIEVKEAFFETVFPIARDVPFAQNLDLNAAVRYADYNYTGGVTSWKTGLNYQPTDSWRLRATLSHDIRAPNVVELFTPPRVSGSTINDPLTGQSNQVPGSVEGNPDLDPEKATTYTFGLVLTPDAIPGLKASIDYYDIELKGAIGQLGTQIIVNLCFEGQTFYCQFIERLPAPDNTIVTVRRAFVNLDTIDTSGIDFELSYQRDLKRPIFGSSANIGIRALGSYLEELATTDVLGSKRDTAGVNGGERNAMEGGAPDWQGSIGVSMNIGNLGLFLQERFISGGLHREIYTTGDFGPNSIERNSVSGRNYTDLTVRYTTEVSEGGVEYFLTVNNLMDQDPPDSPSRAGAPIGIILGTQPTLYDVVGRYMTAGVRFRF